MIDTRTITLEQLAKTIDHSLLKPEMSTEDVLAGCGIALTYNTASVCAKPGDLKLCAKELKGSEVKLCTVIGFPHGSHLTEVKAFEAKKAVEDGAVELDMVINIGHLRSGLFDEVHSDIEAVVHAGGKDAIVKVILENAYLSKEEIVRACALSETAGAAFVKTSTGYAPSGATIEDVKLMRRSVSPKVEVKAAGGIRTLQSLLEMLDAGATRIGATATRDMLDAFARGERTSEQAGAGTY